MPVLTISNDYFVRWPIKIDGVYAEDLHESLSVGLVERIEELAMWWQEHFAVEVTDPPTVADPARAAELLARERQLLMLLLDELGDEYVADLR